MAPVRELHQQQVVDCRQSQAALCGHANSPPSSFGNSRTVSFSGNILPLFPAFHPIPRINKQCSKKTRRRQASVLCEACVRQHWSEISAKATAINQALESCSKTLTGSLRRTRVSTTRTCQQITIFSLSQRTSSKFSRKKIKEDSGLTWQTPRNLPHR